jgi:hypothetical protein
VDGSLANQLCGDADQEYIAFAVCACNSTSGACYSACKNDYCAGQTPSTACNTCLGDTVAGCGNQETACANGCSSPGDACSASAPCCNGYTCTGGACCGASGKTCSLDTDCCAGNVCTLGVCGAPKASGACSKNDDCQSFTCCAGPCQSTTCTNCPANGPTCNTALFVDGSVANQLCGVADQDYIAFAVCACNSTGACNSACKNDYCVGLTPSTACNTCLSNTTTGCGNQENACAAH